jgi:hypothetical protein
MSFIRKHTRLLLVGAGCAAAGAGAGAIATAGASTGTSGSGNSSSAHVEGGRARRGGLLRRFALRAVHGDVIVRTKTGFGTVTFDRGKVQSVSGQQLTIDEGTAKATYKTVTLTIPAGAHVRDDGQKASLSAVKAGQRVIVVAAPKGTYVIARTPRAS